MRWGSPLPCPCGWSSALMDRTSCTWVGGWGGGGGVTTAWGV
jgi:hypothetical protein